ncbi:MAG: sodium-dependent transporter [Methanocorpusculum sp.]|nr:sodium-dependent transporter [Methanocorpusculum sp.]
MAERHLFSNRMGFILATAGAAVGLGNIWRFPYLAAEYGGGIFLLIYLLLVVTLGFTIMITEIAIGRSTGCGVLGAFAKISRKWRFIGYLSLMVPCIILPYYSVIGGWVMKYGFEFITGGGAGIASNAEGFFAAFTGSIASPIFWSVLFILITAVIMLFGVNKGIERTSRVLMPVLFVMLIGLAIYCICMPGGLDGLAYYLYPDFSKFSFEAVVAAMGQLFYSLTLGFGVMITYGSYLAKKENLEKSVHIIEIFDTGVAVLAGLLIVPAAFVFSGGSPESLGAGSGLMFEALPQVFETLPGGDIVGALFFICVFFAALTSAICMYEVPVAALMEKFSIRRPAAVGIVTVFSIAVAVFVCLGYNVLDFVAIAGYNIFGMLDFFANSLLLPVVAILTCLLIGWIVKPKVVIDEIEDGGHVFKMKKIYLFVLKYFAPVAITLILLSNFI